MTDNINRDSCSQSESVDPPKQFAAKLVAAVLLTLVLLILVLVVAVYILKPLVERLLS